MLLFIIFVVTWIFYRWITSKPTNMPPGPPCLPIIGSIPFLKSKNFHFYLEEVRPKYGPVFSFKIGLKYAVAISGPEEVKEVLSREEFQGRPTQVLSPGIMFNEGPSWVEQRRFTIKHLRDFGFGKKSAENVILEEVDEFFRKVLTDDNKIVQVSSLFNTSTVNVLWAMMGGKRYSHDDEHFTKLLECLQKRFRSGDVTGGLSRLFPFIKKLFPNLKAFRQENETQAMLDDFLQKTIDEHKRTKTDRPRDLIDVYLKELEKADINSSFSEETLKNVCTDLFSAGAESVANSLGFCLLYCVLYPEWQEKMFQEIQSYLDGEENGKSYLEGKARMPKVEAFLREVNRSNAIAPLTVPHKVLRDTTLRGYFIPKDTILFVSLWSILQDKNHWKDPENFRPERFLDEKGNCIKDDGWVPIFGHGKRICPGESLARSIMWVFFVSLIKNYEFSIPRGHPKPSTICLSGFTTAPQPFLRSS